METNFIVFIIYKYIYIYIAPHLQIKSSLPFFIWSHFVQWEILQNPHKFALFDAPK